NYGSSIYAQREAMELGCQQVLWLYGEDHQITEVGTMNLFLYWRNEDGEEELATPPLDGIILPGVTRQSILDLAYKWGEFKVSERYVTMSDLIAALKENRVKEMFGAGTACVVCPIATILYLGENLHIPTMENGPQLATRFLNQLTDIQYGREDSEWIVMVSFLALPRLHPLQLQRSTGVLHLVSPPLMLNDDVVAQLPESSPLPPPTAPRCGGTPRCHEAAPYPS
ncbi:hypothetical protein lerEdw1_000520, partial [Lerista edwardsae]